jgi:hypothetical protein
VFAEELTPAAVLAGLRAGRSWIAASRDVDLSLTASAGARTAGVGEVLHAESVEVSVRVRGVADGHITLHTERGGVHATALSPDGVAEVTWETRASGAGFVRVVVRDRDGSVAALTNPILLAA